MSLLNNSSTGPVSRRWLGQLGTLSPALPRVPCLILGFKPPSDDQGLPAPCLAQAPVAGGDLAGGKGRLSALSSLAPHQQPNLPVLPGVLLLPGDAIHSTTAHIPSLGCWTSWNGT